MNIIGLLLIISSSLLSFKVTAGETSVAKEVKSVRFYPQFAISIPQPLVVGAEAYRVGLENFRIFLDTGYFVLPLSNITAKEFSINSGIRYFPFNSGFYTAGSLGYRWLNVSTSSIGALKSADGDVLANALALSFTTFYTTLAFGYNIYISEKVTFGFELGAQIALMGSANQETELNSIRTSIGSDAYARIARFPLPTLTLFRLSWMLD